MAFSTEVAWMKATGTQFNRRGILLLLTIFAFVLLGLSWVQFHSNEAGRIIGSDSSIPGAETDPNATPSPPPEKPLGVIIETQMLPTLVPIILHFMNVLGPSWGIVLYTSESTWQTPASHTFRRAVEAGQIEVRFLPSDVSFPDSGSVSRFLASPWFWEQVQTAPRILMFQADSILCSAASGAVDDFLEYDFIGAPIDPQYGEGFNGGLSIRNPRAFLHVTQDVDFAASGAEFEDQWFYQQLKSKGFHVHLPSREAALKFSVETLWYDKPLGYHQPQRWHPDRMDYIEGWCPEVKMLVGRRAQ